MHRKVDRDARIGLVIGNGQVGRRATNKLSSASNRQVGVISTKTQVLGAPGRYCGVQLIGPCIPSRPRLADNALEPTLQKVPRDLNGRRGVVGCRRHVVIDGHDRLRKPLATNGRIPHGHWDA